MTQHTDTVGPVRLQAHRDEDGHLVRLTVDIHPAAGGPDLDYLVDTGILAGFLAGLAAPHGQNSTPATTGVLAATAGVSSLAALAIPRLALVARDRNGWSWRRIGAALVVHHVTVSRQVTAERRAAADAGHWYDATGHHGHEDDPATAGYTTAERRALAQALAHHRETVGRDWGPVEITPPARITPHEVTTAAVTHRRAGRPTTLVVITTPAHLVGGPADGATAAVPVGADHHTVTAPTGERAQYIPTADEGVWTYQKETNA